MILTSNHHKAENKQIFVSKKFLVTFCVTKFPDIFWRGKGES